MSRSHKLHQTLPLPFWCTDNELQENGDNCILAPCIYKLKQSFQYKFLFHCQTARKSDTENRYFGIYGIGAVTEMLPGWFCLKIYPAKILPKFWEKFSATATVYLFIHIFLSFTKEYRTSQASPGSTTKIKQASRTGKYSA